MKTWSAVDVSGFPAHSTKSEAPLWWGILGLVVIEATVFASLVVSYFYLQMNELDWPPAGVKDPDLGMPTVGTLILLASTLPAYWADKGIERGDTRPVKIGAPISIVLAAIFLVMKVIEYGEIGFRWDEHSYGSIVWAIVSFHSAHVLAVILKTIVLSRLAWGGYFHKERQIGITVNGLYWYFVAGVWVPLYFVLYWTPRLT